ncbi:histidine phosphatase family protein [Corynebacterium sp. CNCTC7651]|uniref:histidine phosphatase family protein n=1 Tax=Corynebacterium sp. CNCTC7651 TaxID=2815361 RepID=UPI001F340CB8|nr:histidine phosphatase family protein [Corynebacterium sp. CNCTC7651]UIZ91736.1 histidine phosphatase family protein [Corynebacterium sp. CNCTC7651]
MGRRLILLRHGQTEYNATRRMQGQLDTELSAIGVEQARAAGLLMRELGVTKIVASDLLRATRTAEIVAAVLGLEFTQDARLRETHLGDWQGKTHAEVDETDTGARAHWRNNAGWAPPEGESRLDVARRARPVVDELMATYDDWDGGAVLLVAHGGTISALTSNLLGFGEAQYPLFKGLGNTNMSRLQAMPKYREGATGTGFASTAPEDVQWYLEAWNQGLSL